MTLGLVLLTLLTAFSFGAIVKAAFADYHVNCVGHGFAPGANPSDGSFFSRVETGCGSSTRNCDIYVSGAFKGGASVGGSATCNAWSNAYGAYRECAGSAHVDYVGVFTRHAHNADSYCG